MEEEVWRCGGPGVDGGVSVGVSVGRRGVHGTVGVEEAVPMEVPVWKKWCPWGDVRVEGEVSVGVLVGKEGCLWGSRCGSRGVCGGPSVDRGLPVWVPVWMEGCL